MSTRPAEVFDLGYRPYDGPRTGRWARRRAIWRDGVRISLGLGRGAGAKVAPWLMIVLALLPVLLLVVIAALPQSDDDEVDLPSYAEYYELAMIPLGLFAAIVAPLLLCPDRRDGVLALYAARPISAVDYVGSRWAAFLTVSAVVAWLADAILFAWNGLDAPDTGAWLADEWDVLPRFLAAGALVAVVLTTLSLFVASLSSRRAYAAVATLAVLVVGSAIGGIAEESFAGVVGDVLSLASVPQALTDAIYWIFGEDLDARPLPGWVSLLWLAGLTAALAAGLLRRTHRLVGE